MSYLPPFPPGPGQGILWALPTIAESGNDLGPGSHGGGTFGGINGTATADLTSGEVTMTSSCGLCNAKWQARWRGFAAPTIPLNSTIAGVYPVCEAREWDPTGVFNSSYSIVGATPVASWNHVSLGGEFGPSAATSQPADYQTVYGPSIGSTDSDITNAFIDARFYQTLNLTGNGTMQIQNPRLAVYYAAPLMLIGHGANCNDYSPITFADGSTSAPGNGLLID